MSDPVGIMLASLLIVVSFIVITVLIFGMSWLITKGILYLTDEEDK